MGSPLLSSGTISTDRAWLDSCVWAEWSACETCVPAGFWLELEEAWLSREIAVGWYQFYPLWDTEEQGGWILLWIPCLMRTESLFASFIRLARPQRFVSSNHVLYLSWEQIISFHRTLWWLLLMLLRFPIHRITWRWCFCCLFYLAYQQ